MIADVSFKEILGSWRVVIDDTFATWDSVFSDHFRNGELGYGMVERGMRNERVEEQTQLKVDANY